MVEIKFNADKNCIKFLNVGISEYNNSAKGLALYVYPFEKTDTRINRVLFGPIKESGFFTKPFLLWKRKNQKQINICEKILENLDKDQILTLWNNENYSRLEQFLHNQLLLGLKNESK